MKFKEEKVLEQGLGKWTVTIDGQEWTDAQKKAKNRLKENLEIPGFRKGKAPANEIEKYMTPSKIFNEGFRLMVGTAFEFAQDQNPKVEPMSSPDPKPVKVSEKELVIEFSFDLRPEIKLGKYKGITTIAKQTLEVTKEEIDSVLTTYQNQFAMEKTKPETGKIESGDIVTFDFKGFVDDKPFKGGDAKDYKLVIGSNQFVPGFEEQMIGLKIGNNQAIEITFPENYTPELANKKSKFVLNIKEIKSREIPARDDELAKDLNIKGISTFKDLEKKVKEDIQKQKQTGVKNQFVNELIVEIAKDSEIALPKSAIKSQIADLKNQFEEQCKQQGLTLKEYKKATGMTDADIEKELEVDAKAKLEAYLVTSEIKKVEKFEVTEELITEKLNDLGSQFGIDGEQLRSMIQPEMVKDEIVNQLIINFLFENNGK